MDESYMDSKHQISKYGYNIDHVPQRVCGDLYRLRDARETFQNDVEVAAAPSEVNVSQCLPGSVVSRSRLSRQYTFSATWVWNELTPSPSASIECVESHTESVT